MPLGGRNVGPLTKAYVKDVTIHRAVTSQLCEYNNAVKLYCPAPGNSFCSVRHHKNIKYRSSRAIKII